VSRLEEMPRYIPHPDRRQWAVIKAPTLILATDTDRVHPLWLARALADAIPNAGSRQVIPKSIYTALDAWEVQLAVGKCLGPLRI
jgi:pimeloyl-ACP methyl ester carboxylesterase